jgi:Cu/Zn superoxide dismutase
MIHAGGDNYSDQPLPLGGVTWLLALKNAVDNADENYGDRIGVSLHGGRRLLCGIEVR